MNDDFDVTPYQETIVKQLITLLNISSADEWKFSNAHNSDKASYSTLSNVCGSIYIPIKYSQSEYFYNDKEKIYIAPDSGETSIYIESHLTDNSLHEAVHSKCLAIQEQERKRREEWVKSQHLKAIKYLENCFQGGRFQ